MAIGYIQGYSIAISGGKCVGLQHAIGRYLRNIKPRPHTHTHTHTQRHQHLAQHLAIIFLTSLENILFQYLFKVINKIN